MSKFQRVMAARRMKFLWLAALLLAVTLGQRSGLAAETRFALVIGNDEYKSAKLARPANDAGLVASVLTAAGFTVTGARNLDQPTLRESVREFLGQVAAAGPDAVAVIYLAGKIITFRSMPIWRTRSTCRCKRCGFQILLSRWRRCRPA
jgi:hypothetical protein